MSTRALAIRNAILGTLRDAPVEGVPCSRVYADLRQAVAEGQRPAIIVDLGDEPTPERQYDKRQRGIAITLRILADGADPFAAIDPIRMAAHALIMADKTLGGLCDSLEEGASSRERVDLDVQIGSLVTVYQARYTTTGEALT